MLHYLGGCLSCRSWVKPSLRVNQGLSETESQSVGSRLSGHDQLQLAVPTAMQPFLGDRGVASGFPSYGSLVLEEGVDMSCLLCMVYVCMLLLFVVAW